MFDQDEDLKLAFLEEAQSLLDDAEAAFISLDEGNHSPELIDKIFRLAHNFKSSAKTVGLQHLSDFAHVFEEVLTKIKKGTLVPDTKICTILLKTLDQFKSYVAGLKSDLSYKHNIDAELVVLNSLVKDEAPTTAAAEPVVAVTVTESSPPPTVEVTESAVAEITETPIVDMPTEIPAPHQAPTAPTEHHVSAPKKVQWEDESLKVNRKKLDSLLNLIGELVVNQSMISGYRQQDELTSEKSTQTLNAMEKIIYEIQAISMALRLTPMAPMFQKLKRIARDASGNLGKTIQFITEGEHVELDKVVLEKISDPLTHLVRNAVDHGIESDLERAELGKKTTAVVTLSAEQKEDRIVITLSDNGRGMNAAKLIQKAIEKQLIPPGSVMSDEEAYKLILKPGFSTKEQVTDMSGRGVGMDVVQKAIEELKGSIQIQTKLGEGTQFIISLPLSMSIITGMVVGIDQKKYVVPIAQLTETVELSHFRIESSTEKGHMFNLRGEVIPIYRLSSILHSQSKDPSAAVNPHRPGLITHHNGRKFSFEIDQIFGQQQIVLKKLGHEMRDLPGIVAGAILNTGEPGLVLSLTDFIEKGVSHAA